MLFSTNASGQSYTLLVQCCGLEASIYSRILELVALANHKSAIKRIRSSERKRQRNRSYRSQTRTQIKRARVAMDANDVEQAIAETREAIRLLDKSANKGIIHPRNAARRKSRLMKSLNSLVEQAE